MENPLKYMNKKLLFVIAGSFISGIFLTIAVYMMDSTVKYLYTSININSLLTDIRKSEDNFLNTKRIGYIYNFQETSKTLISEIDRNLRMSFSKDKKLEELSETFHDYRNNFILVSNSILTLGVSRNINLKESLEDAIKEIKASGSEKELNYLLECAVSEKNFIIDLEAENVEVFNKNMGKLLVSLKESNSPNKKILLDKTEKYRDEFAKLYKSIPKKGLEGQQKEMQDMIQSREKIEIYLKELGFSLKKTIQRSLKIMFAGIVMLFLTLISGTILIAEIMDKSRNLKRTLEKKEIVEEELLEHKNNLENIVDERTKKLRKALEEVNLLSGLLPICSSCKKIRDDKGYWNQIESYVSKYSKAQFSHSICPDCTKKLYPEFYDQLIKKKDSED